MWINKEKYSYSAEFNINTSVVKINNHVKLKLINKFWGGVSKHASKTEIQVLPPERDNGLLKIILMISLTYFSGEAERDS